MNVLKKISATIRLKEAARRAEKAHKETGERYYVMPNGENGKLLIVDRKAFRALKRKNYIDKRATVNDLTRECFYCTPNRNGNGKLPDEIVKLKQLQFLQFISAKTK